MSTRIYFVDFDWTITLQDTCLLMVQTCAKEGWEKINEKWEQGLLSTKDTARETFKLFDCSWEEIKEALNRVEVDPFFYDFVRFVERAGDALYIVSDGYDLLIHEILNREGFNSIPVYANKLKIDDQGNFFIKAPYYNEGCGQCGTCKSRIIRELVRRRKSLSEIIYIGDGYSDRCPIEMADSVFAKEKLYWIAVEKQIDAIKINSFKGVIKGMDS